MREKRIDAELPPYLKKVTPVVIALAVALAANGVLGTGAYVWCIGKGRKERTTPLTLMAQRALQAWLKEPARRGAVALFPNMHGGRLSGDSVQALLAKHVRAAGAKCPSLAAKHVSPHVLRRAWTAR